MRLLCGNSRPLFWQRRAHALARLLHFGVGQADQREARQAVGQMHLDRDLGRVEPMRAPGCATNAKDIIGISPCRPMVRPHRLPTAGTGADAHAVQCAIAPLGASAAVHTFGSAVPAVHSALARNAANRHRRPLSNPTESTHEKPALAALTLASAGCSALRPSADAPERHTVNVALTSNYKLPRPGSDVIAATRQASRAIQGGFDYALGERLLHRQLELERRSASRGTGIEMDFYGGYKFKVGRSSTTTSACCTTSTRATTRQHRRAQHRPSSTASADLGVVHRQVLAHRVERLLQLRRRATTARLPRRAAQQRDRKGLTLNAHVGQDHAHGSDAATATSAATLERLGSVNYTDYKVGADLRPRQRLSPCRAQRSARPRRTPAATPTRAACILALNKTHVSQRDAVVAQCADRVSIQQPEESS